MTTPPPLHLLKRRRCPPHKLEDRFEEQKEDVEKVRGEVAPKEEDFGALAEIRTLQLREQHRLGDLKSVDEVQDEPHRGRWRRARRAPLFGVRQHPCVADAHVGALEAAVSLLLLKPKDA